MPENGATIQIHGFVRSARKQKRIAFAAVGDGSSLEPVQVVMNPEQAEGLACNHALVPIYANRLIVVKSLHRYRNISDGQMGAFRTWGEAVS